MAKKMRRGGRAVDGTAAIAESGRNGTTPTDRPLASAAAPEFADVAPAASVIEPGLNAALRDLIEFQCLMLAPAVVWAGPIGRLLLGAGYSQSAAVLILLAPYIFFCGLAPLVTLGVSHAGETARLVPISLATLALTAACGVILIPSHGLVGVEITADIAFGFYTLGLIWLCRRLFKLRIGPLVWSLARGLTAAAAMGIVLGSVGTEHLTTADFLEGGAGGLAVYVAMLILMREMRGSHIARAAAAGTALVARLRVAAAPRPSIGRMMRRVGRAVYGTIADSLRNDRTPTDRTLASAAAAESADVALAGSTVERVEYPTGISHPRRAGWRARARHGARSGRLRSVLSRMRRPRAVTGLAGRFRLRAVADDVAGGRRPPASRPPAWLDSLGSESVALIDPTAPPSPASRDRHPPPQTPLEDPPAGERRARDETHSGKHRLSPAAQPPEWLSDTNSSHQAAEARPAVVKKNPRQPTASAAAPDENGKPQSGTADVYEIAWRPDGDAGVFELRPVEPLQGAGTAAGESPAERSPRVPWGWQMAPPPIDEARRAHAALVGSLLAAGWQRAGHSDPWFAARFRSRDRSLP